MNNLLDDVKHSFEQLGEIAGHKPDEGGITAFAITEDEEPAPAFFAMREYGGKRLKVMLRRGYRQFAGAPLPESSSETYELTQQIMGSLVVSVVMETFCDGIQIGQDSSHQVKLAKFYNRLSEVFTNDDFREESLRLSLDLISDPAVKNFFIEHTMLTARGLAAVTGFYANTGVSHKIWDLWMLTGTSMITASYLAGHTLGTVWKERDVLSKMEQNIEEDSDDNSP